MDWKLGDWLEHIIILPINEDLTSEFPTTVLKQNKTKKGFNPWQVSTIFLVGIWGFENSIEKWSGWENRDTDE